MANQIGLRLPFLSRTYITMSFPITCKSVLNSPFHPTMSMTWTVGNPSNFHPSLSYTSIHRKLRIDLAGIFSDAETAAQWRRIKNTGMYSHPPECRLP
jgi:hypothetical protein